MAGHPSGRAEGERWLNSGYVLKVKPKEVTDRIRRSEDDSEDIWHEQLEEWV